MGSQALLNVQVERGKATLRALDEAGFDVEAALWFFDEDSQRWRFRVAEPTVDSMGSRVLYERMLHALDSKPGTLSIIDIYAVSPRHPEVSLVRREVTTAPRAMDDIWFEGNIVEGTALPDMLIHRMAGSTHARKP